MKDDFNITGLFYKNKGYKFRKFLNIVKRNSNCQIPDLMIVMMNPGSSKPINGIDDYEIETETIPDRTQDQIMNLMNNCNFNYARILNLSDYRESKSKLFYSQIKEFQNHNIQHSIFSDYRKDDFNKLFIKVEKMILKINVFHFFYFFNLIKMSNNMVNIKLKSISQF